MKNSDSEMPRVLIIAGSDSGGGAGIQADIKTVSARGGYAATAITALTAQNTHGVFGVEAVSPEFVRQQMELVLDDIGADAIKTGMLFSEAIIRDVVDVLVQRSLLIPIVVDPVMTAKGGTRLLKPEAEDAMRTQMMPLATLVTPNIPEAQILSKMSIHSLADMKLAAGKIVEAGAKAVLLTGGHGDGETLYDVYLSATEYEVFESTRIHTEHTHGTGCTIASAIATELAKGARMRDAIIMARAYVRKAIEHAPGFGGGHGPVNHLVQTDENG
ncbi:MAG: bifunctional hydroxymethylpyrimidine kinase/phosphomethylpyrimidine kinase [Rickettsiales bacterium]